MGIQWRIHYNRRKWRQSFKDTHHNIKILNKFGPFGSWSTPPWGLPLDFKAKKCVFHCYFVFSPSRCFYSRGAPLWQRFLRVDAHSQILKSMSVHPISQVWVLIQWYFLKTNYMYKIHRILNCCKGVQNENWNFLFIKLFDSLVVNFDTRGIDVILQTMFLWLGFAC